VLKDLKGDRHVIVDEADAVEPVVPGDRMPP
jgi:hypothetical protein